MDAKKTSAFISEHVDKTAVPTLIKYIEIENQSPSFDPKWRENGLLKQATDLFVSWAKSQQGISNVEVVVLKDEKGLERTPLIFIEIPGSPGCDDTILMYGHLDKQPPLRPWAEGLDPYKGIIRDGRLYGRGGADDGYAIFASILSILALREQGLKHNRIVITIEACEESGSPDLPFYIAHLKERIGVPSLIICLDSGSGNYDQLWLTTSLRGLVVGNLRVKILNEGVHSGSASGIVPSSFRIARQLLSRVEDEKTGTVLPEFLYASIPSARVSQTATCAAVLGHTVHSEFPFAQGATPVINPNNAQDKEAALRDLLLNKAWKPQLEITGVAGIPSLENAGNVLRPETALKLSLRVPPSVDAPTAGLKLKELLEKDPPYGAQVTFEIEKNGSGWDSPALASWLTESLDKASTTFFNKKTSFVGEGGSIPFMGMLGKMFPEAQFVITGVLGPNSNAHGPNEFLDIEYMKKLICCVTSIVHDHCVHTQKK